MNSIKVISILVSIQLSVVILSIPAVSYEDDVNGQRHNIDVLTFKHCEESEAKIKDIDARIEKGLDYLYNNQLPGGEFPTYLSYSPDMEFLLNESVSATFTTALILHTLNLAYKEHNEKNVNEMITDAATFLLNNKESHGVWRYTANDDTIPPDIDDTSVAFSALVESGVNISDESLDYMLDFRNPEGVFYVWFNSSEWLNSSNPFYINPNMRLNEIDSTVNANALYAYSLRQRVQSEVIIYLNNVVENKSFENGSIYYPSPYAFTYFFTKAYSDGNVKELKPSLDNIKKYLLKNQNPDGGWGNDLDTALATTSLINLDYRGEPLERAVGHILNNQDNNGSWDIWRFFIGPAYPIGPTTYFGSKELTTSFSLEALIKYKDSSCNIAFIKD